MAACCIWPRGLVFDAASGNLAYTIKDRGGTEASLPCRTYMTKLQPENILRILRNAGLTVGAQHVNF